MRDQNRFLTFELFACNNDGYAVSRRIHAMARHYLSGHAAKLDPNWHSIHFNFGEELGWRKFMDLPLTDSKACQVAFDYRPTKVELVCPKLGHVDWTDQVFTLMPEPLVALMAACDVVLKPWFHILGNPKHVIELIEGKTIVVNKGCTDGVVRNVRGVEFDVESMDVQFDSPDKHYTLTQLIEEIGDTDSNNGDTAAYVDYLPEFSWRDGKKLETPEAVCEERRAARGKVE